MERKEKKKWMRLKRIKKNVDAEKRISFPLAFFFVFLQFSEKQKTPSKPTATLLPVPLSPMISTPPMPGSTTLSSSASFISSCPARRTNGSGGVFPGGATAAVAVARVATPFCRLESRATATRGLTATAGEAHRRPEEEGIGPAEIARNEATRHATERRAVNVDVDDVDDDDVDAVVD